MIFAIALFLVLIPQSAVPSAAVVRWEIAYDSGTIGGSASLPYAPHKWAGGQEEVNFLSTWIGNSMLAVRFTPYNNTVQMLVGVRFYISGDLNDFNVWIFDSNRQFMIYQMEIGPPGGSQVASRVYRWTVTPSAIGWLDLNVTDLMNPMFVVNDFYVAIEFPVDHKPTLGVDTTGPRSDRGWFVGNQSVSGWVDYSSYARQNGLPDGNLMIRAVTTSPGGATSTTTTKAAPGGLEPLYPAAAAVAVLALVAITILHLRKRRRVG